MIKQLGARIPLVLDSGDTGGTLGSTIVELKGGAWKILREGAVAVADIEAALE